MSDEQRIAEIRARLEAATPGPWHDEMTDLGMPVSIFSPQHTVIADMVGNKAGKQLHRDAALIAAAPTDLAWLCARVEALRGALEVAAAQIEYLHAKFKETGSGNAVLSRTRAVLEGKP